MTFYCIVETEDGRTIAERNETESPLEAAERLGGMLVDPGPYQTFEEATDALTAVERELTEEETGDVPANRPLQERPEIDDR